MWNWQIVCEKCYWFWAPRILSHTYSENGSLSICRGFHAILGHNILHVFRKPGSFVLFLSFSEVIIINCVGTFRRYLNLCWKNKLPVRAHKERELSCLKGWGLQRPIFAKFCNRKVWLGPFGRYLCLRWKIKLERGHSSMWWARGGETVV